MSNLSLSNITPQPPTPSTSVDSGNNRREVPFQGSSELYHSGRFYERLYGSGKNLIKHDNRPTDNIVVSLLNWVIWKIWDLIRVYSLFFINVSREGCMPADPEQRGHALSGAATHPSKSQVIRSCQDGRSGGGEEKGRTSQKCELSSCLKGAQTEIPHVFLWKAGLPALRDYPKITQDEMKDNCGFENMRPSRHLCEQWGLENVRLERKLFVGKRILISSSPFCLGSECLEGRS